MSTMPQSPLGAQPLEGAVSPYVRALRAHKVLVVLVTLAAVAGSIAWLQIRSPEYEASAQLLVSPLPADDETFLGLPIIRESGDPTRVVQTAATLVASPRAADLAAQRLKEGWTQKKVLDAIKVDPQGQSNILEVMATGDSASEAARVANVFTKASVDARNAALRDQVRASLRELRARQRTITDPTGQAQAELAGRIDRLNSVVQKGDPTLGLSQSATPPSSPTGPGAPLIIALALLAGLALGTGAALLAELLDRRIRDEDELIALYPIPVLVRVPNLPPRQRRRNPEAGWLMPPVVREAFRTILAQLGAGTENPRRTLMVTSASSGDGKSTSAVNLAVSIAAAGHTAILMDLDVRKPDIANLLGIESPRTIASLVSPEVLNEGLEQLLVPAPKIPGLKVLSTGGAHGDFAALDALVDHLPDLMRQAQEQAEYVVIDTPPLGEVSDALHTAHAVDAVILVVRPGNTHRRNFEIAIDLLARAATTPAGYLIIGAQQGATNIYYGYGVGLGASRGQAIAERLHLPGGSDRRSDN